MRANATDAGRANAVCQGMCLANVLISFYLRAMTQPDRYVAPDLRRGRGAQSRDFGRFERLRRVDEGDGWDMPEDNPALRTQVSEERPRRLINYVSSPDLSFDRTINP